MQFTALFRLRMGIGLLSVALLLLTLGFNVLLSVSTLDKLTKDSLLSGYRGAGEHLVLGIERGLRFGKPLEQFAGMAEMLQDLRDGADGIRTVDVLDAQGRVLYSTNGHGALLADTPDQKDVLPGAPEALRAFDRRMLEGARNDDGGHFFPGPSSYRIVIPLRHNGIAGGVALDIDKSRVDAPTESYVRWAAVLFAAAIVMACMALPAWISLLTATSEARSRLYRSVGILLVMLIGGMQVAYSAAMLTLFDSFIEKAVHDKVVLVAHFMERDFEYIISKGVDVRSLKGGEAMLSRVLETHPELRGASLATPDGMVLAFSGQVYGETPVVEKSIDAYWPSRFRQREEVLRIRLHMDPEYVAASVRSLGLDLATTLVISLLFLLELTRLQGLLSSRMAKSLFKEAPSSISSANVLRAAGFLFFFGYDMGISFIPLLARTLSAPSWGLSEQVLAGLPISAEMVCAGIALLLAGTISERFGWRIAFAMGATAASAGLLAAAGAGEVLGLIAARGVSGFGFGLVLMAAQVGTLGEDNAGSGIAGVFAGIFAGSICGSAGGALLAERLGFEPVFLVAAAIVPFSILAVLWGGAKKRSTRSVRRDENEGSGVPDADGALIDSGHAPEISRAAWRFFRDPRMHFLLGLIGIPAAVCLTGFLHYMLPLLFDAADAAQSDIGRVFMLYGLCFITVGPLLGKWLDRTKDKGLPAAFVGLLSGAALLMAMNSSTVLAAGGAVLVLGVAQCLAAPSTMLCVMSLKSAQELGRERSASFYRTLERLGQVLGPILFGAALVRFSAAQTLLIAGAGVCILAMLFLVSWRMISSKA